MRDNRINRSSNEFHESGVGILSLVVSNADLSVLPDVILVGKLDSVLVHSSPQLILLKGPSLLVGPQVSIRGFLSGQLGIVVLLLSLQEESLGNKLIISLELGIEGALLRVEGAIPVSLGTAVTCMIEIRCSFEGCEGTGLAGLSGSVGISSSLGSGSCSGVSKSGNIKSVLGGVVLGGNSVIICLRFLKGWLVIVIWETLVAPSVVLATGILEDDCL